MKIKAFHISGQFFHGIAIFHLLEIILSLFVGPTKAWTNPTELPMIFREVAKKDDSTRRIPETEIRPHEIIPRRNFFIRSLQLMSCTTLTTINKSHLAIATVSVDDPFAQLDSIASKISDPYSVPPPFPPSTSTGVDDLSKTFSGSVRDSDEHNNGAAFPETRPSSPPATDTNLSEMEAALRESRKRRQIDPRTHG